MTTKSGQILLDLSKYDPIPEHIILSEELNEKLSVFKSIWTSVVLYSSGFLTALPR